MRWTRNIIVSLLIASTLSSSFLVPLVYLDFEIRRDYIEKVLCIERDKPITVCKGSCVLKGRLDLANDFNQNEQESREPIEIVFFIQTTSIQEKTASFILAERERVFDYSSNYESHLNDIFHPPSV